jgi:redox-sensing transcriptional repressor
LEVNSEKFGRLIHGCPCHSIENAANVIREQDITVGIIAVPDKEAQYVADVLVDAGVRGILNFARTPLNVPTGVYVEDIDLAMSMDRVAYFARQYLRSERPMIDKTNSEEVNKESNA